MKSNSTFLLVVVLLIAGCHQNTRNNSNTPEPEDLMQIPITEKHILQTPEPSEAGSTEFNTRLDEIRSQIEAGKLSKTPNGTTPYIVEVPRMSAEEEAESGFVNPTHDKIRVQEYFVVQETDTEANTDTETEPQVEEVKDPAEAQEQTPAQTEVADAIEATDDAEVEIQEATPAPVAKAPTDTTVSEIERPTEVTSQTQAETQTETQTETQEEEQEQLEEENTAAADEEVAKTPPTPDVVTPAPSTTETEKPIDQTGAALVSTASESSAEEEVSEAIETDEKPRACYNVSTTTSGLNVRSKPEGDVCDKLNIGAEVDVVGDCVDGWCLIEYRGSTCQSESWVKKEENGKNYITNCQDYEESQEIHIENAQAAWDGRPFSAEYTRYVLEEIEAHGENLLTQDIQVDDRGFCPNYMSLNQNQRKQYWLMFISTVAKHESGFDTSAQYKEKSGEYSRGLLQLGYRSTKQRAYSCGFQYEQELQSNPRKNIRCGIKILSHWMKRDGVMRGRVRSNGETIWKGAARYWSVLRFEIWSGEKRTNVEEVRRNAQALSFCN